MRTGFVRGVLLWLLAPAVASGQAHEHMALWAEAATRWPVSVWKAGQAPLPCGTFWPPRSSACLVSSIRPASRREFTVGALPGLPPLRRKAHDGTSDTHAHRFLAARAAATPTPAATPTSTVLLCVGDCDGDGAVGVEEIIALVRVGLGLSSLESCPAGDRDGNGFVTVNEIIAAVNELLGGCPSEANVTFARLRAEVFLPRCASSGCHSGRDPVAGLDLEGAEAWSNLVEVEPENFAATLRGLVRVRPGNLAESFLWLKIQPEVAPEYGGRMPISAGPLPAGERALVEQWIVNGAPP